jgi:hypothetical protein
MGIFDMNLLDPVLCGDMHITYRKIRFEQQTVYYISWVHRSVQLLYAPDADVEEIISPTLSPSDCIFQSKTFNLDVPWVVVHNP